MSVRRAVVAGDSVAALFATGVATWLEVGVEERWTGGEPGVVLASTSPEPAPSPTDRPTAEPTGPSPVFPLPHVPGLSGSDDPAPGTPNPTPARSNAPDHSGGGESGRQRR